jgi:hypothetical protein
MLTFLIWVIQYLCSFIMQGNNALEHDNYDSSPTDLSNNSDGERAYYQLTGKRGNFNKGGLAYFKGKQNDEFEEGVVPQELREDTIDRLELGKEHNGSLLHSSGLTNITAHSTMRRHPSSALFVQARSALYYLFWAVLIGLVVAVIVLIAQAIQRRFDNRDEDQYDPYHG